MTPDPATDRGKRIARLNDRFRETFQGGTVLATAGVRGYGEAFLADALHALRTFGEFSNGNDPYGEHDFGSFTLDGRKLFWKIDYFDPSTEYASDDPADPAVTRRCLTLMTAEEW